MAFVKFDLSSLINAKKRRIKPPMGALCTIIATWFYVGLIGIAPGTLGSIASFPLYYFIITKLANSCDNYACIQSYFTYTAIVVFILGWWAVHKFQNITNTYDHSFVVIDEVLGMLTVFAISYKHVIKVAQKLAPEAGISPLLMAFLIVLFIFRYFDITKTFPINVIDREFHNAFSVMLDDVLAALYASGVIYILYLVIA